MFIPLISAVIVIKKVRHEPLRKYGLSPLAKRYYAYAILIPVIVLFIGLLFTEILGFGRIIRSIEELRRVMLQLLSLSVVQAGFKPPNIEEIPEESRVALANVLLMLQLIILPIAPFVNAIFAFGEEYGWRGFLLQRLTEKYGLLNAIFLTGIIWGLWHTPLILLIGYNYPHHRDLVGVVFFTILTVFMSIYLSWLRIKSGSVYASAIGHGAINAYLPLGLLLAPVRDELYGVPVGLPALLAFTIITIPMLLSLKNNRNLIMLSKA